MCFTTCFPMKEQTKQKVNMAIRTCKPVMGTLAYQKISNGAVTVTVQYSNKFSSFYNCTSNYFRRKLLNLFRILESLILRGRFVNQFELWKVFGEYFSKVKVVVVVGGFWEKYLYTLVFYFHTNNFVCADDGFSLIRLVNLN